MSTALIFIAILAAIPIALVVLLWFPWVFYIHVLKPAIERYLSKPSFDVTVDMPIEECKSKLVTSMDDEVLSLLELGYEGDREFIGYVVGDEFMIFRRPHFTRNSFRPNFYGKLVALDGQKTRICGSFKLHPLVKIFMAIWFTFLLLIIFRDLFIAAMVVAGFGIYFLGKFVGSKDEKDIIAFLENTFIS